MPIVVQKFGGVLLESPAKIRRAAKYVIETKQGGEDPVVVVSAPGRATDHLLRWARKVSANPEHRELDMLLSVGERMAMALMSLAINAEGSYRAVSFTGSQVGIITDTRHTDASIIEVKGYRIREAISLGQIPIIAGFQGISTEKEITTLGRGGSDATAVALAAAIGASRCELVKEAGGIFTADPARIKDARLISELDYGTLESMTGAGAKVVQPRAASLAREHQVVLSISAPDGRRGTLVSDRLLTGAIIAGVTLRSGYRIEVWTGSTPDLTKVEEGDMIASSPGGGIRLTRGGNEGTQVELLTIIGWGGELPVEAFACAVSALEEGGIEMVASIHSAGSAILAVHEGAGQDSLEAIHRAVSRAGLFGGNSSEEDEFL